MKAFFLNLHTNKISLHEICTTSQDVVDSRSHGAEVDGAVT
jgi:hypothetical protein